MTVTVKEKNDLKYAFEAPTCALEKDGCVFDWSFDLKMRDETQALNTTMFVLDPETGDLIVKADLMSHKKEVVYQLDVILYNNVTRPQAGNFTISVDITEEKLILGNFTYVAVEEKAEESEEPPEVDLSKFTKAEIEEPKEEPE